MRSDRDSLEVCQALWGHAIRTVWAAKPGKHEIYRGGEVQRRTKGALSA